MAFVALAGQALRGDAAMPIARGGLEDVEQVELQRLFAAPVMLDRKVRALPEGRAIARLALQQRVEAVGNGAAKHARGTRMQAGVGYLLLRLAPRICDELLDRDRIAGGEMPGIALPHAPGVRGGTGEGEPADPVALHADHANRAFTGMLCKPCFAFRGEHMRHVQGQTAAGAEAWIVTLRRGGLNAGYRRLKCHRADIVDGAQAQADAEQARVRDRRDALCLEFERMPLHGAPAQKADELSFTQVEYPIEREKFALRRIDVHIAQADAHSRRLGDGQARIRVARETEVAFVIVDRRAFPHATEKASLGGTGGFLEAPAYAERPVGQREQGLVARGVGRLPMRLAQPPGVGFRNGRIEPVGMHRLLRGIDASGNLQPRVWMIAAHGNRRTRPFAARDNALGRHGHARSRMMDFPADKHPLPTGTRMDCSVSTCPLTDPGAKLTANVIGIKISITFAANAHPAGATGPAPPP